MDSCFLKSKIIKNVFVFAGAIIAALYFFSSADHLVLRIILAVALIFLCFIVGKIVAICHANATHKKMLDTLLVQGSLQAFLHAYKDIPGKCKPDGPEFVLTSNYLAIAYSASGDYEKAIEILKNLPIEKLKRHLRGLYALTLNSLCKCYMMSGDITKASELLKEMELVAEACVENNPSVSKNLTNNIEFYRNFTNGSVNAEYIQEEIELSMNIVHKNECRFLLATALLKSGSKEDAALLLDEIIYDAPELFVSSKAKKLKEEINPRQLVAK